MKRTLAVVALLFSASMSFASVDEDQDQLGVYFDNDANSFCLEAAPFEEFDVHFVITNPRSAEINGVAFGCRVEVPEGQLANVYRLATTLPPGTVDDGITHILPTEYYNLVWSPSLPGEGEPTVVMTWSFMVGDLFPVLFFLGPSVGSPEVENGPVYLGSGDQLIPLGVSSGNWELPVAVVNGECGVVVSQSRTFGQVKCLFR